MTNDLEPTRQAIAAKDRSGKLTVSGKLQIALDLMLYEGSCRADAAKAAGMTDHGLREAFKKPHVKAYYNAGLEVLRTSTRARNIRRLDSIADTSGNDLAKVAAIKALENMDEQERQRAPGGTGSQSVPGLIIVINGAAAPKVIEPPTVDLVPNKASEDDRH